MLVLSRKINEEILIADNIRISVVQLKNGKVRIGISAPDEVNIRRAELPPLKPVTEVLAQTRLRHMHAIPCQNPILDCTSFI